MPITRKQKEAVVSDLVERLKRSKAVAFAYFSGTSVKDTEALRKLCRAAGVEYQVIRKTLMDRAFSQAGITGLDTKQFNKAVATAIGFDDEVAPAKVLSNFAKDHEAFTLVGGVLEGQYVDGAKVIALSKLPSREELLAKLVGSLNAPVSGLVNVLHGNLRGLVYALNAIRESKS